MSSIIVDIELIKTKSREKGIEWNHQAFLENFGKGTYRWLIYGDLNLSYSEGMDIGLFDLHQNYNREDLIKAGLVEAKQ